MSASPPSPLQLLTLGLLVTAPAYASEGQPAVSARFAYQSEPGARNVLRLSPADGAAPAVGSRVVVTHHGQVSGVGTVASAASDGALAELDWLELDLPETGTALIIPPDLEDRMAPLLPPVVSRPRRVCLMVVAVEGPGGRQTVRLKALGEAAPAIADRLDFFREGRYVGFGQVVSIEGTTFVAQTEESMSASPVREGDVAVPRPAAGAPGAHWGWVFKVTGDYVLVSLGEADGIRAGDALSARAADGTERELEVDRTFPDHSGAILRPGAKPHLGTIAPWTPVRPSATIPVFTVVSGGKAAPTGVAWLFVVDNRDLERRLQPGDFVVVSSSGPTIAVVVEVDSAGTLAYVPGVWCLCGQECGADEHQGDRQPTADPGLEQPAPPVPVD